MKTAKELKSIMDTINKKLQHTSIKAVKGYRTSTAYGCDLYNRSTKKRIRCNNLEQLIQRPNYTQLIIGKLNPIPINKTPI